MSIHLHDLKTYLKEQPLRLGTANTNALLVDLYWYYQENNPSFTPKIHSLYKQANTLLTPLTAKDSDALFHLFENICAEQEQLAFRGGLRMGMQLVLELLELQ